MNCKQAREYLLDVDTGQAPAPVAEHVRGCAACAAQLAGLRRTMSLLDEWKVPEPSPYFDVRLHARLREQAAARVGWWEMLRKPALALALTVVAAMSVMIHGGRAVPAPHNTTATVVKFVPKPGTAVGDLQLLDQNHDLLANIELLDEVSDQGGQDLMNP